MADDDDWEFYQPRYILDRNKGYLWEIQLNLEAVAASFQDKIRLIDFLLRRANSKLLILEVLRGVIEDGAPLSELARIFDKFNAILQAFPEWFVKQK